MITAHRGTLRIALGATAVLSISCVLLSPAFAREQAGASNPTAFSALAPGNSEQAKSALRASLRDNPLDAASHAALASLLGSEGDIDQSIVGFQRVLALDPSNPGALYNLGTLLMWRGEPVAACRLLESAVLARPDHIPSYNNLARAYYIAGLPELAMATYGEVLRRDPSNALARANFSRLEPAARAAGPAPANSPAQSPSLPDRPEQPAPKPDKEVDDLAEVLRDLKYVNVERRGGKLAVTGWTTGSPERAILDRILAKSPAVLDLTSVDSGDPQRMVEIDAILFTISDIKQKDTGFNFLRLIDLNYNYFATDNTREGTGYTAPPLVTGAVNGLTQQGWIFSAAASYSVNIANALQNDVAVLARPHLTALSGSTANFLSGGELVFEVSGLNSGDIKPYPFGTTLKVTPTLLRTVAANGIPQVHVKVDAGRTSALNLLEGSDVGDQTSFQKLTVSSEAVLSLGQTLILSGLSQRENRKVRTGVPGLMHIPGLKYLFSSTTTIEAESAVVVLLTVRDPTFVDERNQKTIADFVEARQAFVRAKNGTPEDMRLFRERYPDWKNIAPNSFVSHFYFMEKSELYRSVSGQDLRYEGLDLELLGPAPKLKIE